MFPLEQQKKKTFFKTSGKKLKINIAYEIR